MFYIFFIIVNTEHSFKTERCKVIMLINLKYLKYHNQHVIFYTRFSLENINHTLEIQLEYAKGTY